MAMFANWCHDPEVCKFLTWNPHDSVEETKRVLSIWLVEQEKLGVYRWGIVYRGNLVGSIDVVGIRPDGSFEIGYCLGRAFWGRGLMSEAFHAVLDFLFNVVGYRKATMSAMIVNERSRKVIAKQGFVYERDDMNFVAKQKNEIAPIAIYRLSRYAFN